MKNKYEDIVTLPHHVSKKHPQMSLHDRAAQFNAFNALGGYREAVNETARITENKIVLGDDATDEIANTLNFIQLNIKNELNISVTYFVADSKKRGGKYLSKQGIVKSIDSIDKSIVFIDNVCVPFDDIYEISIV